MAGLMMDFPLTITHLFDRANAIFPEVEVVSRAPDKSLSRQTYRATYVRGAKLAGALRRLGAKPGDAIATLAWNHHRHLELYMAVPSMGAVVHTLNLRLHPTELAYIANHAKDRFLFVDRSLLPLLEKFRENLATVEHFIVMPDAPGEVSEPFLDYEALLAEVPSRKGSTFRGTERMWDSLGPTRTPLR